MDIEDLIEQRNLHAKRAVAGTVAGVGLTLFGSYLFGSAIESAFAASNLNNAIKGMFLSVREGSTEFRETA